eukprot:TRINITY_DN5829_c0_g1_i13.p1 TRINITY_DN5829_c0_g1~~TRINITY_DN5829_c0_g1_i13.p1  ORF type:complete len:109 (+),score=8.75 TRINITY_DN5829_c0_g1_i13:76-402(+)
MMKNESGSIISVKEKYSDNKRKSLIIIQVSGLFCFISRVNEKKTPLTCTCCYLLRGIIYCDKSFRSMAQIYMDDKMPPASAMLIVDPSTIEDGPSIIPLKNPVKMHLV